MTPGSLHLLSGHLAYYGEPEDASHVEPLHSGCVETKSGSSRRSLTGRDRSITGSYNPTPDLNPNLIKPDPVTNPNLKRSNLEKDPIPKRFGEKEKDYV